MQFKSSLSAMLSSLILIGAASAAPAQEYPARTITLIVPFAAGGPTDVVARIISTHMSKTLGRQIVIENIVGGGGTTATIRAMRAAPDGYTIEMGHMGTHAAAVAVYPNLAYDPVSDFEPIGLCSGTPILILARSDFPSNDLRQFVAYVKAHADDINMAHAGIGSVSFTAGLLFNSIIGIKPTSVTYNGTGPALNALVAGQVDYMFDQISNVVLEADRNTIKVYAVASSVRSSVLPNVPTAREAGLPQFEMSAWNALFAPKGTAKPILDKLTDALDKALSDETTRMQLLRLGNDIPDGPRRGQQALGSLVKNDIEHWTPIIRAAGLVK